MEFAQAWDEATEARLTPWHRETVAEDRSRLGEIEALRQGLEPPQPQDGVPERILELAGQHERLQIPGPNREELLRLLA